MRVYMKRLLQVIAVLACLQIGMFGVAEGSGTLALFSADAIIFGGEAEFYLDSNWSAIALVSVVPLPIGGQTVFPFALGGGGLYYFDKGHQGLYGAARVHLVFGFYPVLDLGAGFRYFLTSNSFVAISGGVVADVLGRSNIGPLPLIAVVAGFSY